MEVTFVVKPDELTPEWLEQLKSQFDDESMITITATSPDKSLSAEEQRTANQRGMFERLRETRKKYPPKEIAVDVDVNKLIDEMY